MMKDTSGKTHEKTFVMLTLFRRSAICLQPVHYCQMQRNNAVRFRHDPVARTTVLAQSQEYRACTELLHLASLGQWTKLKVPPVTVN
jgi:hypothetical protein